MLVWISLIHWPLEDLDVTLKNAIYITALLTSIFRSFYDSALRWMPLDLADDKSMLVQLMILKSKPKLVLTKDPDVIWCH